MTHWMV